MHYVPPQPVMLWGTGSGVGKTLVTIGLCRALTNTGTRVEPFKAIAMETSGRVDNGDTFLSRVGAALRRRLQPHHNPIVLRVDDWRVDRDRLNEDLRVELFILGRSQGRTKISELVRAVDDLGDVIRDSIRMLDPAALCLAEGAGSPAEGGALGSLANGLVAETLDASVVLVSDHRSSSPFGAALGLYELLLPLCRRRIQGLLLNWGAEAMLDNTATRRWMDRTAIPVLGSIRFPHLDDGGNGERLRRVLAENKAAEEPVDDWYELIAANVTAAWPLERVMGLTDQPFATPTEPTHALNRPDPDHDREIAEVSPR